MEIILAIAVVTAVIFFGALISMGNDKQRRAIDGLREQVAYWALEDLRMKREKLAFEVHVDNPLEWLNNVAAKVCGYDLKLQVIESFENPQILICIAGNGSSKVVFTPYSPNEIRAMKRIKNNRLFQYANQNPLLSIPKGAIAFECSSFNNGFLFDLELSLAWKSLTGNNTDNAGSIWMYIQS